MKKSQIKKFIPILQVLQKVDTITRSRIIEHLNETSINCLSECILNGIHGKYLTKKEKKILKNKLNVYKSNLRYISNPNKSIQKKKKYLMQRGGSLGIILTTLLPLITSLFTKK